MLLHGLSRPRHEGDAVGSDARSSLDASRSTLRRRPCTDPEVGLRPSEGARLADDVLERDVAPVEGGRPIPPERLHAGGCTPPRSRPAARTRPPSPGTRSGASRRRVRRTGGRRTAYPVWQRSWRVVRGGSTGVRGRSVAPGLSCTSRGSRTRDDQRIVVERLDRLLALRLVLDGDVVPEIHRSEAEPLDQTHRREELPSLVMKVMPSAPTRAARSMPFVDGPAPIQRSGCGPRKGRGSLTTFLNEA